MAIRRPGKVIFLPVGSFDPAAPKVSDLAAGVELHGWMDEGDTPLLDLGDGITAIYIKSERDLVNLRNDPWSLGRVRIVTYPSHMVAAFRRDPSPIEVGSYVVKDASANFKILTQEQFDGLREIIIANHAEAAGE